MESSSQRSWDALVVGGGACGLMAAVTAAKRGLGVLVLEKNAAPGIKILASGGGHCNFTNRSADAGQYLGESAHFMKSALRAWPPEKTLAFFAEFGIGAAERKHGQLFVASGKAAQIKEALLTALDHAGGKILTATAGIGAHREAEFWRVETNRGSFRSRELVLATGGLAYPQLGATGFALDLARELGLRVTETAPGLVPLTADDSLAPVCASLSGLAVNARVSCGKASFEENVLFTHEGLSGPAILQISSYWRPGMGVEIDWIPGESGSEPVAEAALRLARESSPKRLLATVLESILPGRMLLLVRHVLGNRQACLEKKMAELRREDEKAITAILHRFPFRPTGTRGYRKAEVMRGGVDSAELSSGTLEARKVPGLFIGGEAVDVTGWLGGYNLQWAWASGHAIGEALGK
ncbi:MAG: aminoacetone oxidase family FAD-binding enzyme [Spirochaetes bacterium]|nr:aminoacetone oxidase family FAD-binding enzyme [Spirochaetota bacterium]